MNAQALSRYQDLAIQYASEFGIKIIAAILFWVIGRWLIGVVISMIRSSLERQKVDPTVLRYLGSVITVTLNVLLVVGILGYFGIQTTTFAALIAAAGVAIGLAWSGLLANFAAGAFLVVLRPIKVGDFVTIGGITGTVTELGLFTTTLNTPDNVGLCRILCKRTFGRKLPHCPESTCLPRNTASLMNSSPSCSATIRNPKT